MEKYRAIPFTINNPTDDDLSAIHRLEEKVLYLIVGKEIGKCGTPHYQGYMYFKNPRSLTSLKKLLPRAHFSVPARGTHGENRKYCSKDGDVLVEKGTCPQQGERTDIEQVRDELKSGANMRRIVDVAPSYQSIKMAEVWLKYNEPGKNWKPEVKWFYGQAGSGKTKAAVEWLGDDYFPPTSFKWWEGYDGHENVLLDEIRGDYCKYHEMLKLLDRYKHRVECKGGSRQLLAKKIAITSCFHPKDLWPTIEDKDQLLRRIDEIILFGEYFFQRKEEYDFIDP